MRIFLTGQDGFIGGEIRRLALASGHEVMGLEKPFRMADPPWEAICMFEPEVFIHCAWITTPGLYLDSPENILHREWSVALIRRLAAMGTRRFVVAGTCAEYAASDHPLREGDEPKPSTLYGREKNLLRMQLQDDAARLGFELLWARAFYPYGPGEHPDRLISFLIRNAAEGKESPLKNPFAARDYIHVHDIARAFLLLAEKGSGGIFNIGTGTGVCPAELRGLVGKAFGREFLPAAEDDPMKIVDAIVADVSRISALGWSPRFDIKEGLSTYPFPRQTSQA